MGNNHIQPFASMQSMGLDLLRRSTAATLRWYTGALRRRDCTATPVIIHHIGMMIHQTK
jgi:hypothetical protein